MIAAVLIATQQVANIFSGKQLQPLKLQLKLRLSFLISNYYQLCKNVVALLSETFVWRCILINFHLPGVACSHLWNEQGKTRKAFWDHVKHRRCHSVWEKLARSSYHVYRNTKKHLKFPYKAKTQNSSDLAITWLETNTLPCFLFSFILKYKNIKRNKKLDNTAFYLCYKN